MYLATVLLEPNRWKPAETPLFRWEADTGQKIVETGFTGVELWQGHWVHGTEEERELMIHSPCPVRIFSWYGIPGIESPDLLFDAASALENTLWGIKFNFGPHGSNLFMQTAALHGLLKQLPEALSLLCECHAGTLLEEPPRAAEVLSGFPERVSAIVHPFASPDPRAWFDRIAARIVHLHLQSRDSNGWADPSPDFPGVSDVCEFLRARNFSGTASLEFIRAITTTRSPDLLLDEAGKVRALWTSFDVPWKP